MKNFLTGLYRHAKTRIDKGGLIFFLLLLCAICIQGCLTEHKPDYSQIPLTSGSAPYQLPKGPITDSRGVVHNEKDFRWSISEAELFQNSSEIKPVIR